MSDKQVLFTRANQVRCLAGAASQSSPCTRTTGNLRRPGPSGAIAAAISSGDSLWIEARCPGALSAIRGRKFQLPIAVPVVPLRQARPMLSLTMTATAAPATSRIFSARRVLRYRHLPATKRLVGSTRIRQVDRCIRDNAPVAVRAHQTQTLANNLGGFRRISSARRGSFRIYCSFRASADGRTLVGLLVGLRILRLSFERSQPHRRL